MPRGPFQPGAVPVVAWSSLLGLVAVLGLFALVVGHDRRDLLFQTQKRAEEQAVVLADHAARLFDAAEMALGTVMDESQPLAWDAVARSRPLWVRVRRLADRLPYVEAFWLYGPNGHLRLTSLTFPAPDMDASEREFFTIHTSAGKHGVHVSEPLSPPASPATFRLSRRLEEPDGGFRGVASLTVNVEFFRRFYHTLDLPPDSTVSVLRDHDMAVLVQYPHAPEEAGPPASGRVRAVRQVPGFPMMVEVSIPLTSVTATWRNRIAWRAPMALGATVALAALTWLGFRQDRRQREFQALLEHKVAERTHALNQANERLEELVHEVHHRVNNNLQTIASLMALQASRVHDPGGAMALRQSLGRVHTLSLVHQTLYGTGAMTELPLGDYLARLARDIGDLYGRTDVALTVAGDNPLLRLDTLVPVALIVHETLCNALRHAFPPPRAGEVRITVTAAPVEVTVEDDGVGLRQDFLARETVGAGLMIARSLAAPIGATIEIAGSGGGTKVRLCLPG